MKKSKVKKIAEFAKRNLQYRGVASILGVVFAILWIFSVQLDTGGEIEWRMRTFALIGGLAVLLTLCFSFVLTRLVKLKAGREDGKIGKKNKRIVFCAILVANLLVFLALFPGVYGYDSVFQVRQFLEGFSLGTHYSVLFSFILYSFARFGWVGYAIFIFLQVLFMSYVETRIAIFVTEKVRKRWVLAIVTAFFCIQTMMKILICSSCQDTLFGGLFALIMIHLIELSTDTEEYLSKKKNWAILPLMIFLMMAMRNNGFYVMIIVVFFGMILMRKYWKQMLVLLVAPLVVFKIYTGPIFDFIGVTKSNDAIKEMSSMPVQQIIRAFYAHPDRFTGEEREELGKYFNNVDYVISSYKHDPAISDTRKGLLKKDYVKEHPLEFLEFYARIGAKSPGSYVEAVMMTNMGYYYPFKHYNDWRMYHPLIETTATEKIKAQTEKFSSIGMPEMPILTDYKDFLVKYTGDMSNRNKTLIWPYMAGIRLLLEPGTYFVVLVITVAVCLIKKIRRMLLPLSLMVGLYITLLLAPVVLFRYVFPIILSAPLFLVVLFTEKKLGKDDII